METKNIKLEHSFIVFLCAYLRHIDLSLDRSRWGDWNDYVSYSNQIISPDKVAKYLENHSHINWTAEIATIKGEIICKKSNILYKYIKYYFRRNLFTPSELTHLIRLLERYNNLFFTSVDKYTTAIDSIRIEMSTYYTCILQSKLSRQEWNRIMHVEHYLQNFHLKSFSLKTFITPNILN